MLTRALVLAVAAAALASVALYAWQSDAPTGSPVALSITRVDGGHRMEEPFSPLDRAHVEANAATLAAALREAAEAGRWTTADEAAAREVWEYLESETNQRRPRGIVEYGGARFAIESPTRR